MKGLGLLTDRPPVLQECPKAFGIKTRQHVSPWKHSKQYIQQGVDGSEWATDQVRWFIEKGDAIIPGKERKEVYDCIYEVAEDDFTRKKKQPVLEVFREIVFIACELKDPPTTFPDVQRGIVPASYR